MNVQQIYRLSHNGVTWCDDPALVARALRELQLVRYNGTVIDSADPADMADEFFNHPSWAFPVEGNEIRPTDIRGLVIINNINLPRPYKFRPIFGKNGEITGFEKSLNMEAANIEFKDISSEKFRIYEFDGGATVTIRQPIKLNVSKSGGHRIIDTEGKSHYIPSGWIHLWWVPKEGQPNFVL